MNLPGSDDLNNIYGVIESEYWRIQMSLNVRGV